MENITKNMGYDFYVVFENGTQWNRIMSLEHQFYTLLLISVFYLKQVSTCSFSFFFFDTICACAVQCMAKNLVLHVYL